MTVNNYDGEQVVANTAGSIQFLRGFNVWIYLRMGERLNYLNSYLDIF